MGIPPQIGISLVNRPLSSPLSFNQSWWYVLNDSSGVDLEHTNKPVEEFQTVDESVRGESNNLGTPSGIFMLLVAASTSTSQDACQIISNDKKNREVRQQYGPFEVILEYSMEQSLIRIWTN